MPNNRQPNNRQQNQVETEFHTSEMCMCKRRKAKKQLLQRNLFYLQQHYCDLPSSWRKTLVTRTRSVVIPGTTVFVIAYASNCLHQAF